MSLLIVAAGAVLRGQAHFAPKPFELGQGLTILFPSKPTLDTEESSPSEKVWLSFVGETGYVADVQHFKLQPLTDDEILAAAIANIGRVVHGKIVSQKPVLLNGWQGIEFVAKLQKGNYWGKVYSIDKTLVALGVADSGAKEQPAAKSFLDSLSIPKATVGPHTSVQPLPDPAAVKTPVTADFGEGFTATFPEAPHMYSQDDHAGVKVWIVSSNSTSYTGVVDTAPKIHADDEAYQLNRMMGSTLNAAKATLTAQRDMVLNGWEGLEFQGSTPSGTVWGRVFRVDHSLVELAIGVAGTKFPFGSRKFLDSLQLPKGVPNGPHNTVGPTFTIYPLAELELQASFPKKPTRDSMLYGSGDNAIPLVRYQAAYGDRLFVVVGFNVPSQALGRVTPDQIDALLSEAASGIAKSLNMNILKQKKSEIGGTRGLSAELTGYDFAARVQATYVNGRVKVAFALAPQAIYPSEEIEKFFGSISVLK